MDRAYSLLDVKSVNDADRVIEGIASTPTADRMGDVVEPMGASFAVPMPLLWQHDASQPIGHVEFAKPTKAGIPFKARLVHPDSVDSETLKDRLALAWDSIKTKLVGAVSIGFRPLEYAYMDEGGVRFLKWEWLELSAVTIPANAEATINTIKSIDTELRAASGQAQPAERDLSGAVLRETPQAAGKQRAVKAMNLSAPKEGKMKTITEQIAAFEATMTAKSAEMDTIMDAAADKGETLDADQKETYDTLADEVKEIGEHLVRLRAREATVKATAKLVSGDTGTDASASRSVGPVVKMGADNVPKGIKFVRLLGAKYLAQQHHTSAVDIAKQLWPEMPELQIALKAPIAAGTTTDTTWASPLAVQQNLASEFAEYLVPATIIGRIPGLRRVPFNIKVPRATQNPTAYWVGEGKIKPVSAMAFDAVTLGIAKVAGIVPITEELLRFSSPSADLIIRDGLRDAIAYLTDRDFLDPSKAASDISPASLTNGVTAITPSGVDADALRADLGTLLALYTSSNQGVGGLVLVTTSTMAMKIGLMRNALGQQEFPGVGINGGTLEGIPVIVSENLAAPTGSPADGTLIVAINASEVLLADDGGLEIDVSREASLQMDSAPDSPETASTVTVSLWQHNMVAFKAERFINWTKRRSGAVQLISGANYR
jgi:HK97 family phage major capsid protein/HK97 family phage prohead protease